MKAALLRFVFSLICVDLTLIVLSSGRPPPHSLQRCWQAGCRCGSGPHGAHMLGLSQNVSPLSAAPLCHTSLSLFPPFLTPLHSCGKPHRKLRAALQSRPGLTRGDGGGKGRGILEGDPQLLCCFHLLGRVIFIKAPTHSHFSLW